MNKSLLRFFLAFILAGFCAALAIALVFINLYLQEENSEALAEDTSSELSQQVKLSLPTISFVCTYLSPNNTETYSGVAHGTYDEFYIVYDITKLPWRYGKNKITAKKSLSIIKEDILKHDLQFNNRLAGCSDIFFEENPDAKIDGLDARFLSGTLECENSGQTYNFSGGVVRENLACSWFLVIDTTIDQKASQDDLNKVTKKILTSYSEVED